MISYVTEYSPEDRKVTGGGKKRKTVRKRLNRGTGWGEKAEKTAGRSAAAPAGSGSDPVRVFCQIRFPCPGGCSCFLLSETAGLLRFH